MPRVSDEIIDSLLRLGVKHFFLVVGGNAMYLDDAIRISGCPYTAFHNEQAAAMAAEAYARVSGELAVCVVTSGPGAANLLTGVAGAFLDSAPVLYIAGQAKSTEQVNDEMRPGVRQFGTFELPMSQIFQPVTKKSHVLRKEDDARQLVHELARIATQGRPGPVFLEIPIDLQGAQHSTGEKITLGFEESEIQRTELQNFVETFFQAFLLSKSPLILAGHGVRVAGAADLLQALSMAWRIPVVTTQIAKDLFPYADVNFVGHVGLRGDRAGNIAAHEADLLLCIGTSLQQQTVGYDPKMFAPNSRKFVIDFEGSVSKKDIPIEISEYIDADVTSVLEKLLEFKMPARDTSEQNEEWLSLNQKRKEVLSVVREPHDTSTEEINMYDFIYNLSEASAEDDIIVTDAGLCFYIMGQAYLLKRNQRYIASGGLGSMGYAIPASIGAAKAGDNRVICVTGDGSAQVNIQELATIVSNQSSIVIFIINNGGYASIRNTQKSFFSSEFIGASEATGVGMPDWKKMADAYNVDYLEIPRKANLKSGLAKALSSKRPLLVEVVCQMNQALMPAVSSFRDRDGTLISNPLHVMSPGIESEQSLIQLN